MKALSALVLMLLTASISFAQTDVYLKINHLLGTNTFAFNTAATNDRGHNYEVSRLEYYISEVKVTHDGGQVKNIGNLWLLIDASTPTNVKLDNWNITTIEGVTFSIGVDQATNHLDPAQYPTGHPLAHRAPPMHWGWASGYRFVAMEGISGPNLNQSFEFHALGDANYHTLNFTTAGTTDGSDLVIEMNANYEMALLGMDVNSGPIVHAEDGEATTLLWNFKNYVFYPIDGTPPVSVGEAAQAQASFQIFPNPAASNTAFNLSGDFVPGTQIQITDMLGKTVASYTITSENQSPVSLSEPGVFMVSAWNNAQLLSTQKLLVY